MDNEVKLDTARKTSFKRLQFCNFKLDYLLDTTQLFFENQDIDTILKKFVETLHEKLNIGKILLFCYNKGWNKLIISGVSENIANEIKIPDDLIYYTQIGHLTNALNKQLTVFDAIIPILNHRKQPLAYLLIGDVDEEREGISPIIKHLRFIQTLLNIIVLAIENQRLLSQKQIQEGIKKELDLARRMQSLLIPSFSELPDNEHIKAISYYFPHYEVGGDYFDVIKLSEKEYGFCIADVSGKGISGALLMSNFQANVRALFTSKRALDEIVQKLNHIVLKNTNGEKFITLFIGKYNVINRQLSYINAGHNYPLLYDNSYGKLIYLQEGCVGIGMLDEIPKLVISEEKISPNSMLLLYTDGITELENEEEKYFGTDTMEKELIRSKSVNTVVDNIIKEMTKFKGKCSYNDDVTMLALEFRN